MSEVKTTASGIPLSNFEYTDRRLFPQTGRPTFTVNVDHVAVNALCVRLLPNADYVEFMVDKIDKKLILKPCPRWVEAGYVWAREKGGKLYPRQRVGIPFIVKICHIMDWDPFFRYKVYGAPDEADGEDVITFDLLNVDKFPRNVKDIEKKRALYDAILKDWNGEFGEKYGTERRSMRVNRFDECVSISVNEKIDPAVKRSVGGTTPASGITPASDTNNGVKYAAASPASGSSIILPGRSGSSHGLMV